MGKAKIRGQETRGRAIEEILVFEVVWVKAVETKWNKGFHFIWNEKYLGVKLRWAACPGWPGIFLIWTSESSKCWEPPGPGTTVMVAYPQWN